MRKPFAAIGLFMGSAAISFALAAPNVARAAVRTLASTSCWAQKDANGHYWNTWCSIPAGTDFPTSAIQGAYFDYYASSNEPVTATLSKYSYTGTYYSDDAWTSSVGQLDTYVKAVNVLKNPSVYDYLSATITNIAGGTSLKTSNSFIGVAVVNNK